MKFYENKWKSMKIHNNYKKSMENGANSVAAASPVDV